jgi:hypothetical protein
MERGPSISHRGSSLRVQAASARWIAAALALTPVVWLAALAGLLAIANRVHDDVPYLLAIKLPLLQSRPELIFAGESRTVYQIDPNLAAQLIGKPPGAVVNIAYDAGEPLALEAAMHRQPDRFVKAHVVVSVAPFLFNEGVRSAAVYPQDVAARLGVVEQMSSFLPLRVGTLIRFIREAFVARLAADQFAAFAQLRDAQGLQAWGTSLIMALADRANQFVDAAQPWKLRDNIDRAVELQSGCTIALMPGPPPARAPGFRRAAPPLRRAAHAPESRARRNAAPPSSRSSAVAADRPRSSPPLVPALPT